MTHNLSREDIAEIVRKLDGTCGEADEFVIEEFGITQEQIEEIMAEENYEKCPECQMWVEAYELVDDDSEECPCDNCRK